MVKCETLLVYVNVPLYSKLRNAIFENFPSIFLFWKHSWFRERTNHFVAFLSYPLCCCPFRNRNIFPVIPNEDNRRPGVHKSSCRQSACFPFYFTKSHVFRKLAIISATGNNANYISVYSRFSLQRKLLQHGSKWIFKQITVLMCLYLWLVYFTL